MDKYHLEIYCHTLSLGDEESWIEINALGIQPELIRQLDEFGIVEICEGRILAKEVVRVQKLIRLQDNLEVNLPGAAIIIDLLEKVEVLQDEIRRILRR